MKKESFYCEQLESNLHFLPDKIKYCCSGTEGLEFKFENSNKIDKSTIIKTRQHYIKQLRNGNIPQQCKGCTDLKKDLVSYSFWDNLFFNENKKITKIIVNHFKQCECNCIYCTEELIYKKTEKSYQLLPLVKQLYEYDLIDRNKLEVEFQGGNVSVLDEFEDLINEFYKNDCRKFYIATNGIKYLPILDKISENAKFFLSIPIDSGTSKTFNNIKRIDAFEQTMENIKKFSKKENIKLVLKYIVVKDYNNNIDELKKFLAICNEYNCCTMLTIDYRDTIMNNMKKFEVPEHYYQLFDYATEYCKENNMDFYIDESAKLVLENKSNQF